MNRTQYERLQAIQYINDASKVLKLVTTCRKFMFALQLGVVFVFALDFYDDPVQMKILGACSIIINTHLLTLLTKNKKTLEKEIIILNNFLLQTETKYN